MKKRKEQKNTTQYFIHFLYWSHRLDPTLSQSIDNFNLFTIERKNDSKENSFFFFFFVVKIGKEFLPVLVWNVERQLIVVDSLFYI